MATYSYFFEQHYNVMFYRLEKLYNLYSILTHPSEYVQICLSKIPMWSWLWWLRGLLAAIDYEPRQIRKEAAVMIDSSAKTRL